MGYPSETNLEIKSLEVSFSYILLLSYPIAFEILQTIVTDINFIIAVL